MGYSNVLVSRTALRKQCMKRQQLGCRDPSGRLDMLLFVNNNRVAILSSSLDVSNDFSRAQNVLVHSMLAKVGSAFW